MLSGSYVWYMVWAPENNVHRGRNHTDLMTMCDREHSPGVLGTVTENDVSSVFQVNTTFHYTLPSFCALFTVFFEVLPLLQNPTTSLPTLPIGLRANMESYFFPWCSHTVLEIPRCGQISEALMPCIISIICGNSGSQKWLFLLTLELSFHKPIWTWSPLCFSS